jgi:alpha-1,6-mannosyltransferase
MPPLFSRDLYSYIAQGRLMDHGINPYTHGVGAMPGWFQLGADPMWAEAPTPYGPLYIAFQGFVAHVLPTAPWWSMLALKSSAIVGLLLIAAAVTRLAEQHGLSAPAVFWLTALNPLMLLHLVAGGHNDSLMIAGMLWAFVFANNRKTFLALVAITAAAGIKPIALLALPFVALAILPRKTTWKAIVGSWIACTSLVIGALSAIGAALGLGLGWIGALSTPGSVRTLLSPATAFGQVIGFIGNGFNLDITDGAISFSRALFMATALVFLALIALRPEGQAPLRQAGLAFTAVVALSPVMQPWYLLWALPLVVCSGLARSWHLRTIVLGTSFFVIYALADMNVVTDSAIDATDFISIFAAGSIVLVVLLTSKRERELVIGDQYALGLKPTGVDDEAIAQAQKMTVSLR